jgi:cytochrome c biogenesis protein CcmG/thiol:disulfide interchange protein DsbE
MVTWSPAFCLIILLLTIPAEADLRIGSTLPPVLLPAINGSFISIPQSVRGKVVILHFWQVGCSSCALEMPAMNKLYIKYRNKGLEVLAVNVRQKKETVKSFADGLGVNYQILIDAEGKCAALYGVNDVPRTYVIDRYGVVRYRIFGGAGPELLKKLIFSLF